MKLDTKPAIERNYLEGLKARENGAYERLQEECNQDYVMFRGKRWIALDREECIQEAIVRIMGGLDLYDPKRDFDRWRRTVMYRTMVSVAKKARRHQGPQTDSTTHEERAKQLSDRRRIHGGREETTYRLVEEREEHRKTVGKLKHLKGPYLDLLDLYIVRLGKNQGRAAATAEGLTRKKFKSTVTVAKKTLRKMLEQES